MFKKMIKNGFAKFFCGVFCLIFSSTSVANQWHEMGFQYKDGAMPVYAHGDYVEPYFAVKALLVAHWLGVDVAEPAKNFAVWLAPRQKSDGRFMRYCKTSTKATIAPLTWHECREADADDSIAALWCILLLDVVKDNKFDSSCQRSIGLLAKLWNPQKKVYRSLLSQPFAQFADNVEITAALKRLQKPDAKKRFANVLKKYEKQLSLTELHQGLASAFDFQLNSERMYPSKSADNAAPDHAFLFYPNGVMPLYVWMYDLAEKRIALRDWALWKETFLTRWLAGDVDEYPWGLVAYVAEHLGDHETSRAWLKKSQMWRGGKRWNILEEGVWLGLSEKIK